MPGNRLQQQGKGLNAMNTVEKITHWLTNNTNPQTAAQIAAGIEVSAGTVRKNLKKMGVVTTKVSNVGHYALPITETPAEVVVSTPETPAVKVNTNTKAAPRALIEKVRERVVKHRERMENGSTPRERQQGKRHWKRATRRLETLVAVHG
jgi:hypothetical protein